MVYEEINITSASSTVRRRTSRDVMSVSLNFHNNLEIKAIFYFIYVFEMVNVFELKDEVC